jgi:hypothetical protein
LLLNRTQDQCQGKPWKLLELEGYIVSPLLD